MKNKGFTLVEVLGVLIILILIFMLVIPSVTKIISTSKDTVYQKQVNTILKASYDWSLKNIEILPEKDNTVFITLSDLIVMGLIDETIIEQKTSEYFTNDLVISITNVGTNYEYSETNALIEGDYLYKLELDMMSSEEFDINRPPIDLLDGDLPIIVDLNSDFSDIKYIAESKNDEDLTNDVNVFITFNDKIVSQVDTSKIGIYYINYTVVDKDGYSNTIVKEIIISDISAPILTIPEETKITKNTTDYDLLSDVSCVDNSNYCDITTAGKIKFGVVGDYIIEYTVKDPSGNTETIERLIEIIE